MIQKICGMLALRPLNNHVIASNRQVKPEKKRYDAQPI
jgi:hypothetical protein